MPGSVLIDTNIIIALLAGEAAAAAHFSRWEEVFVPSIALGEMYYGAMRSARREKNIEHLDEFSAKSVVLGCDALTARHYGSIKHHLRQSGRPLPENDVWIAAIALQHGLTIASRDAHFTEIAGVRVESWE